MTILNYSTTINASQTIGEIQRLLARAGARSVQIDYDEEGEPEALMFLILYEGHSLRFRLPCNHEGIYSLLKDNMEIQPKYRKESHARSVAWRIIKDWVEAQLAIIEAKQAHTVEVFLPYLLQPSTGITFWEEFQKGHLLTSGSK